MPSPGGTTLNGAGRPHGMSNKLWRSLEPPRISGRHKPRDPAAPMRANSYKQSQDARQRTVEFRLAVEQGRQCACCGHTAPALFRTPGIGGLVCINCRDA
jgi:hypothetical protein